MRFAVIHCRHDECGHNIWVPESKLGTRGRCPNCGHVVLAPAVVPPEDLIDGPPILLDLDAATEPMRIGRA